MTFIFELRRQSVAGIFAVCYRRRRVRGISKLPDGAIVEFPRAHQRREAPISPPEVFELASGGIPATIHHANLGLIVAWLPLTGLFLLPSGDIAAVYGAEAVAIDVRPVSAE